MTATPWHCSNDGPWWKRWRIRIFGLTAREWRENDATVASVRVGVSRQQAIEDAEDELTIVLQEMTRFSFEHHRDPRQLRISPGRLAQFKMLRISSNQFVPLFDLDGTGLKLNGIPVREDLKVDDWALD